MRADGGSRLPRSARNDAVVARRIFTPASFIAVLVLKQKVLRHYYYTNPNFFNSRYWF
jgi:hypothetical protein